IERRIILRGFVHKVVVISTKPLALEAEIYSDFGVFRGSKFAVLPSTGSQETTRKGDFDRESLNPIGLSMPSMTEFELPLKGSRGRSRT
ncbi:hypothetical protein, partial [Armatimonas sp.]|uniref:hypothetical protein n=1 Tax=Armatimonas sp. TaxID=1872638 RepID=UPI003753AFB0